MNTLAQAFIAWIDEAAKKQEQESLRSENETEFRSLHPTKNDLEEKIRVYQREITDTEKEIQVAQRNNGVVRENESMFLSLDIDSAFKHIGGFEELIAQVQQQIFVKDYYEPYTLPIYCGDK